MSSAQGLSMQVVAPCEPGWHALIAEFEKTVHIYIGTFRSFSTQLDLTANFMNDAFEQVQCYIYTYM